MVKSSSSLCQKQTQQEIASESILKGPYQYQIIEEPGDLDHTPPIPQLSHLQTDDELTPEEAKQVDDDDQAI
ncbi:hypothetical protein Tco_0045107 [Tanacetum coccineum]